MKQSSLLQITVGFLILVIFGPNLALAVSEKQITTTDIGTYDISLKTNPASPQPDEKTHLIFEVISKKIHQAQEHVDYQILILKNNNEVFYSGAEHTHSGQASVSHVFDSSDEYVVAVFIDGVLFKPIPIETASFILAVGETKEALPESEIAKGLEVTDETDSSKTQIPEWIKQIAEFWIADQIDDSGFIQLVEYLVQQGIITIPYADPPEEEAATAIPIWIKTNAEFWINGDISNDEFAVGLEWLINNGIIQVQDASAIPVSVYEIEGNLYPTVQFILTPNSPDCPDYHLHATSGHTVGAILTSFTDHNPGSCGLGTVDSLIEQNFEMTKSQILEWEKVTGIKILE